MSQDDHNEPQGQDKDAQRDADALLDRFGAVPRARAAFRSELRDAFSQPNFGSGSLPEETSMPDSVRGALDSWGAEPPSTSFRERMQAEFLGAAGSIAGSIAGATAGSAAGSISGPKPEPGATDGSVLAPTSELRSGDEGRRHRRDDAREERKAQQRRSQFRLVTGAGVLAAAAAVALIVRLGLGGADPVLPGPTDPGAGLPGVGLPGVTSPDSGGSAAVASVDRVWTIDRSFGDAADQQAWLDEIRIDGETVASMDAMEVALATARVIETGSGPIRLQRGDEYVLELDHRAVLRLDGSLPDDSAQGGSAQGGENFAQPGGNVGPSDFDLYATQGAVRVATGPGFRRDDPLVIATPHVRTEVLGTVYGIDVTGDYSCICCLKGHVHSTLTGGLNGASIRENQTRFVQAGQSPRISQLVADHRTPLVGLQSYWS